jgi:RNA polymerase sigma-70 factor (ECF subfamily)
MVRSGEPQPAEAADPAQDLVRRAMAGDVEAFGGLVAAFQDRIFRVITAVLHCDRATAEDLCQEVFLRVHRSLSEFDGSARFHAWIHTIATNVAITEHRRRRAKKRGRTTVSIDAPIAGTDDLFLDPAGRERDPADRAHQSDFVARVRACVRELPDEFRDAVVLRDMEGLSYEEIASVLDLPPGTVRSRIHRGRLLLQDKLKGFLP